MDYEKKYNEALERLRAFHRDYDNISTLVDVKGELESIFPELRESEDEKTRKDIRDFILNRAGYLLDENTEHRFIAYLEKQKEKVAFTDNGMLKSLADEFAEVTRGDHEAEVKQDYSGLTDLERAIHRGFLSAGVENVPVGIIKETARECHAQMKTAEHAENIGPLLELKTLYGHILEEDFTRKKPIYSQNEIIRRLVGLDETIRSIRTPWRPTDAQMDALDNIASSFSPNNKEYDMVMENINSLREDLLKLKFPKL